ncbi:MAG: hypothetical protein JNJ43_03370 [Anaerolineales bacterium]|nr:hypothetical protein [Anaerolineales bacterium]
MPVKNLHLMIRFSDTLYSVGDVVSKHNSVANNCGYVWFGKIGATISQNRIDIINKQIDAGIPTYLFLAKGNRKKLTFYRATLLKVSRKFEDKKKYVPKYYYDTKLIQYMHCWLKVTEIEPIESSALQKFKTVNSVFPLIESMARSSSGYFLVHEDSIFY